MTRLINADDFIEEARNRLEMQDLYLPIHIKELVIDEMPTVDAEPVRHATLVQPYPYGMCSCCNDLIDSREGFNYCPYCGARLDGDSKEE